MLSVEPVALKSDWFDVSRCVMFWSNLGIRDKPRGKPSGLIRALLSELMRALLQITMATDDATERANEPITPSGHPTDGIFFIFILFFFPDATTQAISATKTHTLNSSVLANKEKQIILILEEIIHKFQFYVTNNFPCCEMWHVYRLKYQIILASRKMHQRPCTASYTCIKQRNNKRSVVLMWIASPKGCADESHSCSVYASYTVDPNIAMSQ